MSVCIYKICIYVQKHFLRNKVSLIQYTSSDKASGKKLEADLEVNTKKLGADLEVNTKIEHLIENFIQEPQHPRKSYLTPLQITPDFISSLICIRSVLNVYLLRLLLKCPLCPFIVWVIASLVSPVEVQKNHSKMCLTGMCIILS